MRVIQFLLATTTMASAFVTNTNTNNNRVTASSASTTSIMMSTSSNDGENSVIGRRQAFQNLFMAAGAAAAAVVVAYPQTSNALDMDAFMSSELEKDQKNCNPKTDPKCAPKMTSDEALCKYGQSGKARGEACMRYKAAGGALPTSTQVKSLGGAYAM